MEMCQDDSDILTLSFENRCQCKACPGEIQRAIMSFDGVKEMRKMDYEKGTAELIVKAVVAENPKKLCDWILKKARKHASIATAAFEPHGHNESFNEEKIIYREFREVEIHRKNSWWK